MPSEKNSQALVQKYYAVTEVRVICSRGGASKNTFEDGVSLIKEQVKLQSKCTFRFSLFYWPKSLLKAPPLFLFISHYAA